MVDISDWNFSTTTLINIQLTDENNLPPPPPDPKGPEPPPPPPPPAGENEDINPAVHSENLEWKQTLGIFSLILLGILITFVLLQIKLEKECLLNFKKGQLRSKAGRTLFIFFFLGLVCSITTSIVFIDFIFNMNYLSEIHAYHLSFTAIPYQLERCVCHYFSYLDYILYLKSAMKINVFIVLA